MENMVMENLSTSALPVTISNIEFFPNSTNVIIHANLTEVPLNDSFILPETSKLQEDGIEIKCQKEKLCRVCGCVNEAVNLERIFGDRGIQIELHTKIFTHLHLQVEKEDNLPQQVCSTCIYHLNICHHLLQASQAADAKLRQLFLLQDLNHEYYQRNIVQTTLDEEAILYRLQEEKEFATNISEAKEGSTISKNDQNEYNNNEDCTFFNDSEGVVPENSENNEVKKVAKKAASSASLLCHICGKSFKLPRNLQAHEKTHLEDLERKKFKCSLCSCSFISSYHLSEHMNVHNNTTPYKCDTCDKLFHKRSQLRQHLTTHSDFKFSCPHCTLPFKRKSNLVSHMKVHKKDRMFKCKLCGEQFPLLNALLSHRKTHSTALLGDQKGVVKCSVCGKLVSSRGSLESHMRQHTGAARLECDQCGKVMRSRNSLAYHWRSQHSDQRPHNCATCGQGFMTRPLLAAHQASHTGEKPFRCNICSSGFRSGSNLRQHMAKHKPDRKYPCTSCDKKFKGRTALKTHMKSHSGEKPFICDVCGRSFFQKFCLVKHQKVHLKPEKKEKVTEPAVEVMFTCDICSGKFHSVDDLAKHKDEVHNNVLAVVPPNVTSNVFETQFVTEDGQNMSVSYEPM